jgi:hypothetical protein
VVWGKDATLDPAGDGPVADTQDSAQVRPVKDAVIRGVHGVHSLSRFDVIDGEFMEGGGSPADSSRGAASPVPFGSPFRPFVEGAMHMCLFSCPGITDRGRAPCAAGTIPILRNGRDLLTEQFHDFFGDRGCRCNPVKRGLRGVQTARTGRVPMGTWYPVGDPGNALPNRLSGSERAQKSRSTPVSPHVSPGAAVSGVKECHGWRSGTLAVD